MTNRICLIALVVAYGLMSFGLGVTTVYGIAHRRCDKCKKVDKLENIGEFSVNGRDLFFCRECMNKYNDFKNSSIDKFIEITKE